MSDNDCRSLSPNRESKMSHDTPCYSVVWLSRGRRDDTGTPENKNIHICVWSKVDGVLIGDIPGYFYSILVLFCIMV